jgi:hypothetical protein
MIKSRRMRWVGHVAGMGVMRNAHRIFFGKPEGKRPAEKLRLLCEDNIKTNLTEVGLECMDWTRLF